MKISVCIATYNGEKYIKRQLDSILFQISMNDEIIISDDSSTDNTIAIIESFHDRRIKLLKNNMFYSPIFNIENAIKYSSGDYIFLADQDDIWNSTKIEKTILLLKDYDCVVSDATIINQDDEEISLSFYEINHTKSGFLNNLVKNGFIGCCMAFKSSLKPYILPFPNNIPMHDSWIGLNAYLHGKVIFSPEKLIQYRRHGNNVSMSGEKSNNSLIQKMKIRYTLIKNLRKRQKKNL